MDDCVYVAPKNKIENIYKMSNNYDSKLKFAIQKEQNNELRFSNFAIIKRNNQIHKIWNTKETHLGRMSPHTPTLTDKILRMIKSD